MSLRVILRQCFFSGTIVFGFPLVGKQFYIFKNNFFLLVLFITHLKKEKNSHLRSRRTIKLLIKTQEELSPVILVREAQLKEMTRWEE